MTPIQARQRLTEAVEFHQSEFVTVPAKLLQLALQSDSATFETPIETAIETIVQPTEPVVEPLKKSRKAK